jgi:hypothetical protein
LRKRFDLRARAFRTHISSKRRVSSKQRVAVPRHRWNTPPKGPFPLRSNGVYRSGTQPSVAAWFRRAGVLGCVALAVLTNAARAGAAAGQWQAGGRVGMAWLDGPRWGPSGEAFVRHGLDDALALDFQLVTSLHPFQPDTKLLPAGSDTRTGGMGGASPAVPWLLGVTPGLSYRWDVLQVIPFAGLGFGVYASEGLSSSWRGLQLGAVARAGVEYLLSRDVVLSVQASTHLALTESPIPSPYIQLTAGAGYAWGW